MNDISSAFEGIGTAALVALGVLVLIQLTLMTLALVSLVRRPAEGIRGPKWLWALVVVFGELVGPIVYFAVARKPEKVDMRPAPAVVEPERAEAVADVLYGSGAPEDEV